MKDHTLKIMLDKKLIATIHSDDPAYFGGYMNDNFKAVAHALNLSREDIATLAYNAIEASFASDLQKQAHRSQLDGYCRQKGVFMTPGPAADGRRMAI
jgi:adenosine deaminase